MPRGCVKSPFVPHSAASKEAHLYARLQDVVPSDTARPSTGERRWLGSRRPAWWRLTSGSFRGEGGLRSFGGGLLVTCGLQNVGEPSVRNGEELGLHGRISNTPVTLLAREVRWDGENCLLQARAEVRESKVFGADLVLTRTVSARVGEVCVDRGHRAQRGPCTGTSDALVPH